MLDYVHIRLTTNYCLMRGPIYVKRMKTIPVPQIHSYGQDDTIVKGTSTTYMVMEFIRGQRLQTRKFLHATYFQRRNIYIDLINILAQLRQLEFPAVVSLTPNPDNPDDETHPAIGPLHSMPINKFERKSREPLSSTVSAKSLIDLHCHILPETYQLPVEELEHGQAKKEIFALHSVLKGIEKYTAPAESKGTFILAHPDLRCGNIIINDDFHILGIIDWEFAVTVPAKLFVPPLFTTGHYPKLLLIGTRTPRDRILQESRAVLEEMHATSAGWTRLWQDWEFEHKDDTPDNVSLPVLSPLLEVLRHPSKLTHV